MRSDEKLTDAQIDRLEKLYQEAQKALLEKLNTALLTEKTGSIEHLDALQKNVDVILKSLQQGNKEWCEQALPHLYTQGLKNADVMLRDIGAGVGAGFSNIHQQAVQVLADNAYGRLTDVVDFVGRRTDDIYRNLALESVRGTVIGYETWREVAKNYRQQLAEQGITGFVDRAGKQWNMDTYATMVARTSTMECYLQGTQNRLLEQGQDLVVVSQHSDACELCVPWEGQVLSLTGKTEGYPTLEEARAGGLFHPNCRHAYGLYLDIDAEIAALEEELTEPEPPEKKEPKQKPDVIEQQKARIEEIREGTIRRGGGATVEEAREAGRFVMADLEENRKERKDALDAVLGGMGQDNMVRLDNDIRALMKESNSLASQIAQENLKTDKDVILIDRLRKERSTLEDERHRLQIMLNEKTATLAKARDAYRGAQEDNCAELSSVLGKYRLVGMAENTDKLFPQHMEYSKSKVVPAIKTAYNYYPQDWSTASIAGKPTLTPRKRDRGYYSHHEGLIVISGNSEKSRVETAIHELAHRFERVVPGLRESEKAFYAARTAGEPLEWLGPGYKRNEVTRKDRFIDPYMGKDYRGQAYELASMGFELAYTNPTKLWEDREFAEWIYGLLLLH